jgi:RNA polymerase sigma-70 factor (ECF subfamily)
METENPSVARPPAAAHPPPPRTFEQVVAEYETQLLRYAAGFLRDASAAQDVVQDVLIKLARNWDHRRVPDDDIRFWLYRITHNVAIDHLRREQRLRRLHQENLIFASTAAAPVTGDTLSMEQKQEMLLAHVSALADPEREVLLLRLQQGLSYRDISQVTGRTEGNVGCLLHNAVKNLARELKKKGVI